MDRFRRPVLAALVLVIVVLASMLLGAPAAAAQSDEVVIELNFETATGESPAGEVAVLNLNSGTEYRNDRVPFGDPIEVDAVPGVITRLQIRRTDLQPGDVSCDGAREATTVPGSRGQTLAITPGNDRVVCTVTLLDELPVTGLPATPTSLSVILLGAGALLVGASRSTLRA